MDADQSKIATKTDGGYYLSNYKGIGAIFKWLVDLVEFISYEADHENYPALKKSYIWEDITQYDETNRALGREYADEYILATNSLLIDMDQAARKAAVSEFVRCGWGIFGTHERAKYFIELNDKLCEQADNSWPLPANKDYLWTAIEALAGFYLGINNSCEVYGISAINDNRILAAFCAGVYSFPGDNGGRFLVSPEDCSVEDSHTDKEHTRRGRISCRSMRLSDYFTIDPNHEIEQIRNCINGNPGKSRSEAVAIEIIRLKDEGKLIDLNGRFSGFIDQLRSVIPDLPSRQSICRYLHYI